MKKPVIGISQGNPNGVSLEVIIKTFQHQMMYDYCVPVVYGNPKSFAFHKKSLEIDKPTYVLIKNIDEAKGNQLNLISTSNESVEINFGQHSEMAGAESLKAIDRMMEDAKNGKLDAIVTGPVDKSTIKTEPGFTGHTSYITTMLNCKESLMVLFNDDIRVGLLTEHLPINQVSESVKREKIIEKLRIANESLKKDFGILKPKIAVLGLNPHNGDNGTMGTEEKDIIMPAIKEANDSGIFCFGPYSADGFFGMKSYTQFDMVLAMYHDQGLIPFKSMAFEDGVNYTAGLPIVRTSPDHGTGYEIAGKNIASPLSFTNAVFSALNIFHQRKEMNALNLKPLRFSELRRERFRLEQN